MSTGNPPRPSQAKQRAAERSGAARGRIKTAQRRRQLLVVGGAVLAIAVIVGVLVIVAVATDAGSAEPGQKGTAAPAAIARKIATVPTDVLDQVGAGDVLDRPVPITAPPLTQSGKPEIFYMGAEFCPYCAGERWALAVALERFGDLHHLGQTTSSPTDTPPSLQTLSFHGASYTSTYLALTAKEVLSNQVVNGRYAPLDKLSPAQQAFVQKYDGKPYLPSAGGIPFVDFGGKYAISGATYDVSVLQGKTRQQIAAALSDPSTPIAQAVGGAANGITAAICTLTGQRPGTVCTSAGVRAAAATLGTPGGAAGASTLSPSATG